MPPATLYRHINKLVDGGLLYVIDQRPVRGTIEKVYALHAESADLSADISNMSRYDHMRTFMMFVASLIDDYHRYLAQDHFDMWADGVSIRQAAVYLTDEEFMDAVKAMRSALEPVIGNFPGPGRRRRTFSNIIIPEPKKEC